jgi:mannosyltransferase OCH1-like enzyme
MIPKIIHYCWFGNCEMSEIDNNCIASWHKYMPDWEYKLWNEDNFNVNITPYTKEAYEAKKYAFVSDYVRLWALYNYGGLYLDVDFEVYKPFDDLLAYSAFAGYEGSKYSPVMMGVIASVPKGEWVTEQMGYYANRHFIINGKIDLTTNVTFVTQKMFEQGFISNGKEQKYKDLHIFPVDYFCPRLTTGEYVKSDNTYCEHKGILSTWAKRSLKAKILNLFPITFRAKMIKMRRKLIG